ncbi:hypothetical protein [Priestia megaterium]|uniref:hypothetical protein n=1 Tax=Priestia megaterium TaxID=1404 RepID=UPI002A6B6FD5|nr:hypothetical protein [Priestia megaterium]MDY0944343.1 hypothetical protein [Priestia megaterium]
MQDKNLMEEFFIVSHISTYLTSVTKKDEFQTICSCFQEKNYDVIGYKEDSCIIGYLCKKDFIDDDNEIEDKVKKFAVDDIIAVNTPLIDALKLMQNKERLFLINKSKIESIITRADLQKPPIRMLFFGLITLFESEMANFIRNHYPNNRWVSFLSDGRISKTQEIYQERVEKNTEIDLLDCTQFADKSMIMLQNENLYIMGENTSKTKAKRWMKNVEELRNDLAHAQSLHTWFEEKNVISLITEVEEVLQRILGFGEKTSRHLPASNL